MTPSSGTLPEAPATLSVPLRRKAGIDLIERANRLREEGPEGIEKAVAAYQEAADILRPLCAEPTAPVSDDLASALANEGIAWARSGSDGALGRALGCFDAAIALREPLAVLGNPWFGYNLAGVWLNKADVLARTKPGDRKGEALAAFDRALELLRNLPADHPSFGARLALGYLNRGTLLVGIGGAANVSAAVACFDEAHRATERVDAEKSARMIGASALANKADALARHQAWDEGRFCALEAIRLLSGWENTHLDVAAIGLKARHALCACAAPRLSVSREIQPQDPRIDEALEAAEAGLRLGRPWRDDPRIQPLVLELFRFGAQVYARRQPHFLAEFLRENITLEQLSTEGLREISEEALSQGIGTAATRGFASIGRPEVERSLATLRELRIATSEFRG